MSETLEKPADTTTQTAPVVDAGATAKAPATALTDPGGDEPKQVAPATWPDDWRIKVAGEDEKALKTLGRFADPAALFKSYEALRTKMSSGEVRAAPPGKDATAEEVAAYRKDAGVPDAPTGYLEKLPDGLVIGEADKPLVEVFAQDMHALNAPPAMVHQALQSYYKVQEVAQAQRAEADARIVADTTDALRADWGADYRRNINAVTGMLKAQFGDQADNFIHARMADGTPLTAHADIVRGLLAMALEANPAATVVPGVGASAGKGIEDRINEIEAAMKDPKSGYFKDEKMQAEYRTLLDARERQRR